MLTFLFALTGFASACGGVLLLFTLGSSQSAPQQAAGAALTIGLAVIPYVFSRCVQVVVSERHRLIEHEMLLKKLSSLEILLAQAPRGYEAPRRVRVEGEST